MMGCGATRLGMGLAPGSSTRQAHAFRGVMDVRRGRRRGSSSAGAASEATLARHSAAFHNALSSTPACSAVFLFTRIFGLPDEWSPMLLRGLARARPACLGSRKRDFATLVESGSINKRHHLQARVLRQSAKVVAAALQTRTHTRCAVCRAGEMIRVETAEEGWRFKSFEVMHSSPASSGDICLPVCCCSAATTVQPMPSHLSGSFAAHCSAFSWYSALRSIVVNK